jgi:hypothetical protein
MSTSHPRFRTQIDGSPETRKENVRILAELKHYVEAQPKQRDDLKTIGTLEASLKQLSFNLVKKIRWLLAKSPQTKFSSQVNTA